MENNVMENKIILRNKMEKHDVMNNINKMLGKTNVMQNKKRKTINKQKQNMKQKETNKMS